MSLLSVIIPSYNEVNNIANTAKVLSKTLEDAEIEYELIFVSDGSIDGTYDAIVEESKKNSKVEIRQFEFTCCSLDFFICFIV